jgi:hypothetical protein
MVWWSLLATLATALGLRLWLVSNNGFLSVDAVFYLDQTTRLLNQGVLHPSCFPPGWPLLVAGPAAFLDHGDPAVVLKAAQHANALLGTVFVLLTFILLRPRCGGWGALAGAVLVAFLPENLILAKTALSEMSYASALLGAWLLARRRLDWRAGLLFGFAYLIRPEALFAAAGLAGHHLWRERRIPWSFGLAVLAGVVPYVVFLKATTGDWSLSGKTVALTLSLQAHPGASYLGLVLRNLGVFLPQLPGLAGWPLALVAVLGAVTGRGRWLWMLAPMLPIPFIINPMVVRFWAPYLPFLLLAVGEGVRWLLDRPVPAGPRVRRAVLAVLLVAGLAPAVADDAPWVARNGEAYHGLRDAGLWLRDKVEPDTIVAAYKPYTSYWAGCAFIKYPDHARAEELVAWARNNGAEYMVVNVSVVHSLVPALDPLLQSPLPPSLEGRITLVQLLRYDVVDQNTAVYRVER